MTLNLQSFFIVCPLVFLAGFIDAIGGGGGFISLPAYLIAGIPPHSAVATNKLSASIGTIVSTGRYITNGYVDYRLGIPGLIMALIGAQIGARLALLVNDDDFYGPGTGTFLLITYTVFGKMDVLKAGGNTKLANLASNLSSLLVFILSGNVLITLGLVASVFGVLGNYLGVGFAMKHGAKGIRYVIIIVIALLFIKLLFDW